MRDTVRSFGVTAAAVLGAAAIEVSPAAAAGFVGGYAPENWTFSDNAGGALETGGVPDSITLTGGNSGVGGFTSYTIEALASGTFKFDWLFSSNDGGGPVYDPFVVITDSMTQAPAIRGLNIQSGSFSQFVEAGTTIGWGVETLDGAFGEASVIVSNFSAPAAAIPTPALLPGLVGLGVAALRKKAANTAE